MAKLSVSRTWVNTHSPEGTQVTGPHPYPVTPWHSGADPARLTA
ncbi:hypothetical protein T261_07176 [Streptomyces lydicus]|nr:hypothetical protein T261_07176 [Streptomyces lydicus]